MFPMPIYVHIPSACQGELCVNEHHADPFRCLGRARRPGGAPRPVRFRPRQALGAGPHHLQPQQAHHQGRAASLAQHGEHLQGDGGDRLRPVGAVRRAASPRGCAGERHPGDRPCPGGRQRLFRRCRLPGGRGLGRGGLPGPGRPERLCAGDRRRQHGAGLSRRRHRGGVAGGEPAPGQAAGGCVPGRTPASGNTRAGISTAIPSRRTSARAG